MNGSVEPRSSLAVSSVFFSMWVCMRAGISSSWVESSLQVCSTQRSHQLRKPRGESMCQTGTTCLKLNFVILLRVQGCNTSILISGSLTYKSRVRVSESKSKSMNPPGFRRTGLFFPLQKRTLLKTLKMCLSHRDLGSLLGLERLLLVATLSLLDSRAWRFCRIRELAMAAAISPRGGRSHRGKNICSCSVSRVWGRSLFSPEQGTCLNGRIHRLSDVSPVFDKPVVAYGRSMIKNWLKTLQIHFEKQPAPDVSMSMF